MNDSERLLLFLPPAARRPDADPDGLLHTVRAAKSPSLLQYARGWLTLVAQEFRVELQEALLSGPRGKAAHSRLGWPTAVHSASWSRNNPDSVHRSAAVQHFARAMRCKIVMRHGFFDHGSRAGQCTHSESRRLRARPAR